MTKTLLNIGTFILLFPTLSYSLTSFSGIDIKTNKPITESISATTGTVALFLSAKCPCSNSHITVIKKLAAKYKQIKFIAINSNADETPQQAKDYFLKISLSFMVLRDNNSQLADSLKAFKTPHAFLLDSKGQIVYQGGITNSSHAPNADEFFLENALSEFTSNKPISKPEGRTLGCVILRENEVIKK